jgi:tRNA modification GTPase
VYRADTIVACATPPGRGAVAVVRLSGPEAFAIADELLAYRKRGVVEPWRLRMCIVRENRLGGSIDEALSVRMPAPNTYTGEDIVEIQCHGSPLVVERIVGAAIALGARAAERGEFSRRSVLNGRIDLAQAEAIADLIDARLGSGAAAAWRQLQGSLSSRLRELRAGILTVLAEIEANVDFSDEELPKESVPARVASLHETTRAIVELLAGFEIARRHREGRTVVFAGAPNAGKSSLVNALLGDDRMIVSDEPGTTRDSVEETLEVSGLALVVTDSAGLRDSPSPAEAAAVERARTRVAEADIVVLVVDGARRPDANDLAIVAAMKELGNGVVVLNKGDLGIAWQDNDQKLLRALGWPLVITSAVNGAGCAQLARLLVEIGRHALGDDPQTVAISRIRHRTALEAAHSALLRGIDLCEAGGAEELAAVELRESLARLAEITDPVGNEDVLDQIFSAFCIGK